MAGETFKQADIKNPPVVKPISREDMLLSIFLADVLSVFKNSSNPPLSNQEFRGLVNSFKDPQVKKLNPALTSLFSPKIGHLIGDLKKTYDHKKNKLDLSDLYGDFYVAQLKINSPEVYKDKKNRIDFLGFGKKAAFEIAALQDLKPRLGDLLNQVEIFSSEVKKSKDLYEFTEKITITSPGEAETSKLAAILPQRTKTRRSASVSYPAVSEKPINISTQITQEEIIALRMRSKSQDSKYATSKSEEDFENAYWLRKQIKKKSPDQEA